MEGLGDGAVTLSRRLRGFGGKAALALVATVSNAFYQWLVLVSLAKFSSLETVGYYAIATAVFWPVFRVASLSLREITASNFSVNQDVLTSFQIRVWSSVAGAAVSMAILAALHPAAWPLFAMWTVLRFGESLFDCAAGLYQRRGHYGALAVSAVVRNVVMPGLLVGLLWSTRQPTAAFALYMLAPLIFFVAFDFGKMRAYARYDGEAVRSFDWLKMPAKHQASSYLYLAAPITAAVFVSALNTSVPRLVGSVMLTPADVGIFGALTQLAYVFVPFLTGIVQASMPTLGKAFQSGQFKLFNAVALGLSGVSLVASAVIAVIFCTPAASRVIEMILSDSYADRVELFVPLTLMTIFSYFNVVMGPVSVSQLQYKSELIQNLAVLALGTLLCLICARHFGVVGIVYGATAAQAVRSLWLGARIYRISRTAERAADGA